MGEDGTYEGTYIGMIDHNATVIAALLAATPRIAAWRGC
jgi:manganese/zinc/iron transport system substrate-binding protein